MKAFASERKGSGLAEDPRFIEEEFMCPECLPSAALMISGVMSTGGLTALVVKIVRPKKADAEKDLQNKLPQEKSV